MTLIHPPSTKDDILQYLIKHGEVTAQTLAETLGVSPQAVRRHLKDLEVDELIEHHAVQEGMGRPHYFYCLSRKGRDRFPAQYDTFALSLLDTLAETVGREEVKSILRRQWERKALAYRQELGTGSLQERVNNLVKLRQAEGYMAEWHKAEPSQPGHSLSSYIITEYNCAISQIAESYPSVCGHELEMFQVALPDCAVSRTHWLVDGEHRCGYLVQEKA
ncbi:MAG: iron-sulfur cluster biosynthesis transcriptional regulator SufR [Leptolyngbyaceae cyanobacterium SM1_1_3]|nr:iron-sulfur cluster biosynthesis transcriptional regulator SufR [Leptolyngbyaceae cyanobacterium SM1_1_3]NJN04152.1 iron-sulfur cluster biosynthesis transcriptional regulator SufR [Leptolyngbyaceae cyanobacterium RM1_1_2]